MIKHVTQQTVEMNMTSIRCVFLIGSLLTGFKTMIYLRLIGTLSLALLLSHYAHAQGFIWSSPYFTSTTGGISGAGPLPNREVAFDHVSTPNVTTTPSLNPVTGIFIMAISTNDAGRTLFADALNSPGFAGFVAKLTDSANDYLRFSDISPFAGWGTLSEADFLGRSASAPDFAGYNITQIGLRINSYYDWFYEPENRYLNTMNYSLDFYLVPVPEPSTLALLALGGATVLLFGSKARRRR